MEDILTVVVDSRLRLKQKIPRDFAKDLKAQFTYSNPDYHRKNAMGLSTWDTKSTIKTFEMVEPDHGKGKWIVLPRGGTSRLRAVAAAHGYRIRWRDLSTDASAKFPRFCVNPDRPDWELRWYQDQAVEVAVQKRQGVIRAPTGSGKTIAAFALIHRIEQRTMVVMRDGNLLNQWKEEAQKCLGLTKKQIGIIKGGVKYRPGLPLVLALQQSLWKMGPERLAELFTEDPFGMVLIDEVQGIAAKTFMGVIDHIPTRYRIGVSADETRKDRKEFLTYDAMGDVIYEIKREELEAEGVIHPVKVRVIPSDFRADWYVSADGQRDFSRLIEEMTEDPDRNDLILDLAVAVAAADEVPALLFTHRRDHAYELADAELSVKRGISCGLLLGGSGVDRERFESDSKRLMSGSLKMAMGTFNSLGVGINLPAIRAGIITTPISGKNPQFFNQVRGRICRTSKDSGKTSAVLYYVWDRAIFPRQLQNLRKWNQGNVEILQDGKWVSCDRG